MNNGPLLTLLSTIFFSIMGFLVKYAAVYEKTGTIVFYRAIISFIIILPIFLLQSRKIKIKNWKIILLRSVLGGAALMLFFKSIRLLTLGEATVLVYTYPIFSSILAFLILKEPIKRTEILLLIVSIIGITLIVNPDMNFHIQSGYIYGILSGILAGGALFSLRIAAKTEQASAIVLIFMAVVSIMSFPLYLKSGLAVNRNVIKILIAIGIAGGAAQLVLSRAYHYCRVIVCSNISLMTVVFSLLLSVFILHENYKTASLIGMALVFTSTTLLIVSRQISPEI